MAQPGFATSTYNKRALVSYILTKTKYGYLLLKLHMNRCSNSKEHEFYIISCVWAAQLSFLSSKPWSERNKSSPLGLSGSAFVTLYVLVEVFSQTISRQPAVLLAWLSRPSIPLVRGPALLSERSVGRYRGVHRQNQKFIDWPEHTHIANCCIMSRLWTERERHVALSTKSSPQSQGCPLPLTNRHILLWAPQTKLSW